MSRAAIARQTQITRNIKAAQKAGLKVVGVRADGTVLTASQDVHVPEWHVSVPQVARPKKVVIL